MNYSKVSYAITRVNTDGVVQSRIMTTDTLQEAIGEIETRLVKNPNSIYEITKLLPISRISRKVPPIELDVVDLLEEVSSLEK